MSSVAPANAPYWFGRVINGCDPSLLDGEYLQTNLRAGVRAFSTTVAIKHGFVETCLQISTAKRIARDAGVGILTSAKELDDPAFSGLILGMQNTSAAEGSFLMLDALIDLGVRIVQLTYNEQNLVGSGCLETHDTGLSDFGKELLKRLEDRHVLVDLSHCGRKTAHDAIDAATRPLVFTHANCHVVCPSPRNRTDEEIRAVAKVGGVVGLNAFPRFVDPRTPDVEHLARHAAHIAEITSPENVSLGLDFIHGRDLNWVASLGYNERAYPSLDEWPKTYAAGIEDITRISSLVDALAQVGFSQKEIMGILGDNLARVLHAVLPAAEH